MNNTVKLFGSLNQARSAKVPLLIIALATVMVFTFASCGNKISAWNSYSVKSTDGSGQVPLYPRFPPTSNTAERYVPDGTEFQVIADLDGGRYEVKHDGDFYSVDKSNFAKLSAKSSRAPQVVLTILAVGVFVVLFRRNKKRSLNSYTAYYVKKRREFPWLEDWINANVDPTKARAADGTTISNGISIILFIGIIFVGSFFFIGNIVAEIINIAVAFLAGELYARRSAKHPERLEPETGLTLECPSCHCPHAWGMTHKKTIVEDMSANVKITTRTRSGGKSSDWGFGESTVKSTSKETTGYEYKGRSFKDFNCQNCGHTEHNEYEETWYVSADGGGSRPETGEWDYNPPMMAWEKA